MATFIFSCEHASRKVPKHWRGVLDPTGKILSSHRAYDRGAHELAVALARRFHAPLFTGRITRLLVDLNRPVPHREVFSSASKKLSRQQKQRLVAEYHAPYWQKVSDEIARSLKSNDLVVHLSIHSFTPRLGRQTRGADIGLLYDPGRSREAMLCAAWKRALTESDAGLRVRRNYPYRGTAAGLTSSLRSTIASRAYVGVELEVSQRLVDVPGWPRQLWPTLADSLGRAVTSVN